MAKRWITALWVAVLLTGSLRVGSAGLVADPDRGVNASWDNPSFAGRDFWIMLDHRQRQRSTNAEEFVRDTGVARLESTSRAAAAQTAIMTENKMCKTLAIRRIELLGEEAQEDLAPGAAMRVAGSGEEVTIYETKALTDGVTHTAMVVRGKASDLPTRFQPLAATIEIELPGAAALGEIRIHHGVLLEARIQVPRLLARQDGAWRDTPCRVRADESANLFTLFPDTPVKTAKYRLDLRTRPYLNTFHPERLPFRDQIKTHPFSMLFLRVGQGRFLGLRPENFNMESFTSFLEQYGDTFTGFHIGEWESNVKGFDRKAMLNYLPAYTNRTEALAAWKHYFDYQKTTLFDTVHALSGGVAYSQYAAAWGAKTISMETAGNLACLPVRSMLMATRGGSRQFGVPWEHYIAYFLGNASTEDANPGWGKSVSQVRREIFTSYYMGATFVDDEGGMFRTPTLTEHGRSFKELHAWAQSEKGARGQSYTPILLLVDYHHGRMGRRWGGGGVAWKIWNELPMEDGDYMTDQVIRATDPPIEEFNPAVFRAPYSVNTLNSRLGDVFDMFFANPPQHGGVIKKEHLDRYPVAMLLGDVAMTPALGERLKAYVREGGTLVVNAAQAKNGLADPEFLGVAIGDKTLVQHRVTVGKQVVPMDVRTVTLKGAEVAMPVESGRAPVLTRNSYGKGHVLLATPEYLLLKDKKKMNPLIEELLMALQREVLPFRVEGPPCQFLVNRIGANHWRLVLINNAGVIKHPYAETEYQVPKFTAAVSIAAPEGATAQELLTGTQVTRTPRYGQIAQTVFGLDVPPGGVQVLDIRLAGDAPPPQ